MAFPAERGCGRRSTSRRARRRFWGESKSSSRRGCVALSRPLNPFESRAKTLPPGGVAHFHKRHASLEVHAKLGMAFAVLAFWTPASAICQGGFEAIEDASLNIQPLADYQTRQVLPYALPHDSRLAVAYGKTLFTQDRGDMKPEPLCPFLKFLIAGKRKVICIPCVSRASRFRKGSQSAIQPVATEIGKRRRGRRALRQMGTGILPASIGQAR